MAETTGLIVIGSVIFCIILIVGVPLYMLATRVCPHCKERIPKDATVCKHCARDVEPKIGTDAKDKKPDWRRRW